MTEERFKHLLGRADAMGRTGQDADYWAGYKRGVRRAYHGEAFGTDDQHETHMGHGIPYAGDRVRQQRVGGYRDGYTVDMPEPLSTIVRMGPLLNVAEIARQAGVDQSNLVRHIGRGRLTDIESERVAMVLHAADLP